MMHVVAVSEMYNVFHETCKIHSKGATKTKTQRSDKSTERRFRSTGALDFESNLSISISLTSERDWCYAFDARLWLNYCLGNRFGIYFGATPAKTRFTYLSS